MLEKTVPEIVDTKLKKLKLKYKSSGVVIKDVTDKETQKCRKCKVVGLLKQFMKLSAQTV